VSKTQTFTVAAPSGASQQLAMVPLAASGVTPTVAPYGSGNPYPITSPTQAATNSTDTSTRSAVVSTTSGNYNAIGW
jgi:hypothetical protein